MTDSKQPKQSKASSSHNSLKRSLGFWDNLLFGVGSILGAGIYAIIGEVAGLSGSLLWLSLLIAAVTALLTACCYGELVSMFPDSGGGYEYISQALGRRFANIMSAILFLTGVVSPAAISLAFGEYLGRLWDIDVAWSASGIIVLMAIVNVIGARNSSRVNTISTVITIAGLAVVIGCASPEIGSVSLMETAERGWTGVFSAAALAFFSYVGFEDVVKLAEETKQPRVNTPWSLVTASLFAMVVYVAVAVSAASAVDWRALSESQGALSSVMRETWGQTGVTFICLVALFATSKCILSNMLSNSRLLYDLSRDTAMPSWMGYLLPAFQTPVVAIVFIAVVTWLFSLIGNLGQVASISNLCVLTLFLLVNISLVVLRITRPDLQPKFRLPFNVKGVSIISLLAILSIVLLIGFNIANLVSMLP
ncbi:MAG: amino acid permease [Planctomycetaceae bacterium]|nr:amino acid permease [Planctomycetaceae bacterium]